jgi:hypothetical protein
VKKTADIPKLRQMIQRRFAGLDRNNLIDIINRLMACWDRPFCQLSCGEDADYESDADIDDLFVPARQARSF